MQFFRTGNTQAQQKIVFLDEGAYSSSDPIRLKIILDSLMWLLVLLLKFNRLVEESPSRQPRFTTPPEKTPHRGPGLLCAGGCGFLGSRRRPGAYCCSAQLQGAEIADHSLLVKGARRGLATGKSDSLYDGGHLAPSMPTKSRVDAYGHPHGEHSLAFS